VETSSGIIQILGFIFVLVGITLIFVRAAVAVTRGKARRLRLALEISVLLPIIHWFIQPALELVNWEEFAKTTLDSIAFLWVVSLAFLINSIFERFLWDGILSDHGTRRVPKLISDGLGLVIYAIAIMLVLHYVYDEPIGAILATSGAAAVVIGFGAQSTIREVFSGVALNATQALRVGDFVEIDEIYGQVHDINWRSVSLLNPHTDSLYIFPNSAVAERTILNFSEPTDRFRYFVKFSVELSAPPEVVIRSIAKELKNSRYVFRDPKPNFNMLGYSAKGIDYRVRYYFDGDDPWWDAQNEVIMAIWAAMRKQGFRISMNRMLQGAPDEWPTIEERVGKRVQNLNVIDALSKHPVMSSLNKDELEKLVNSSRSIDLNPPSCFYKKGDTSDGIYFLLEGEVNIFDISPEGLELMIDTVGEGGIFGFGAALGKRPHHYVAQASQYSIAIHIPIEKFEQHVSKKPKLKQIIKKAIDEQNKRRALTREAEHKSLLLAQHHRHRRTLSADLRRGLDDMMHKPILRHVMGHLFSTVRNQEIVEGIMAGAAIIVTVRGMPDKAERDYLVTALKNIDILRHIDIEHGLVVFDEYTGMLMKRQAREKNKVIQVLKDAGSLKHGADIIMNISQGLCGVHELPSEKELEALATIASALGKEAHIAVPHATDMTGKN